MTFDPHCYILTNCDCGTPFSVEHALSCPKGGFPSIRHNEIQDLTANLMSEVCNDVSVEPHLQPITSEQLSGVSANTQDGARLDIAANGLWGSRYERTFFDVRVSTHMPPQITTPPPRLVIASMRSAKNSRSRTFFLHSACNVSDRGPWPSSNGYLQAPSHTLGLEVGSTIQPHNGLAKVSTILFPATVLHSSYQRCSFLCRQSFKIYPPN